MTSKTIFISTNCIIFHTTSVNYYTHIIEQYNSGLLEVIGSSLPYDR